MLGFEVAWSWSDDKSFETPNNPTFACVCRGQISVFLCQQGQGQPGAWLSLNVDSLIALDAIHQEYIQSGACIIEPPVDCPRGMREMLIEDPDGNRFRIGCPASACPSKRD